MDRGVVGQEVLRQTIGNQAPFHNIFQPVKPDHHAVFGHERKGREAQPTIGVQGTQHFT